jgi:osmotically-inducible protein OsmY
MAQSTALVVLPSAWREDDEGNTSPSVASLLARSVVDLCLAERVERALHSTRYRSLRGVEVSVCSQLVILRGRVPSYYMKQLVQAVAMEVAGVRELRNEVQVVSS